MGILGGLFSKKEEQNIEESNVIESDISKKIRDLLGFESEFFTKQMDDTKILKRFRELKKVGCDEGFTPIILVSSDTLLDCLEINEEDMKNENKTISDLIQNVSSEKGYEFLCKAKAESEKYAKENGEEFLSNEFVGEFMKCEPMNDFMSYFGLNYNETGFLEDIIIAKVPTKNSWEIPLYIQMGGWNDCPKPENQACVLKYWFEKYGAEIAVITSCEMEFYLENPISDESLLENLALEHFLFCSDRVFQCSTFGTINGLASELKNSKVWYFWWD